MLRLNAKKKSKGDGVALLGRDSLSLKKKKIVFRDDASAGTASTGGSRVSYPGFPQALLSRLFDEQAESPDAIIRRHELDIWSACRSGDADAVRFALAQSPDLIHLPEEGRTPLYYAARWGHADIVRMLLDLGAKDIDGSARRDALNSRCRQLLTPRNFLTGVLKKSPRWGVKKPVVDDEISSTTSSVPPQQLMAFMRLRHLSKGLIEEEEWVAFDQDKQDDTNEDTTDTADEESVTKMYPEVIPSNSWSSALGLAPMLQQQKMVDKVNTEIDEDSASSEVSTSGEESVTETSDDESVEQMNNSETDSDHPTCSEESSHLDMSCDDSSTSNWSEVESTDSSIRVRNGFAYWSEIESPNSPMRVITGYAFSGVAMSQLKIPNADATDEPAPDKNTGIITMATSSRENGIGAGLQGSRKTASQSPWRGRRRRLQSRSKSDKQKNSTLVEKPKKKVSKHSTSNGLSKHSIKRRSLLMLGKVPEEAAALPGAAVSTQTCRDDCTKEVEAMPGKVLEEAAALPGAAMSTQTCRDDCTKEGEAAVEEEKGSLEEGFEVDLQSGNGARSRSLWKKRLSRKPRLQVTPLEQPQPKITNHALPERSPLPKPSHDELAANSIETRLIDRAVCGAFASSARSTLAPDKPVGKDNSAKNSSGTKNLSSLYRRMAKSKRRLTRAVTKRSVRESNAQTLTKNEPTPLSSPTEDRVLEWEDFDGTIRSPLKERLPNGKNTKNKPISATQQLSQLETKCDAPKETGKSASTRASESEESSNEFYTENARTSSIPVPATLPVSAPPPRQKLLLNWRKRKPQTEDGETAMCEEPEYPKIPDIPEIEVSLEDFEQLMAASRADDKPTDAKKTADTANRKNAFALPFLGLFSDDDCACSCTPLDNDARKYASDGDVKYNHVIRVFSVNDDGKDEEVTVISGGDDDGENGDDDGENGDDDGENSDESTYKDEEIINGDDDGEHSFESTDSAFENGYPDSDSDDADPDSYDEDLDGDDGGLWSVLSTEFGYMLMSK